jgi:hypothetical protein
MMEETGNGMQMAELTTKYTPLDGSGGSSSHSQEDEEQQQRRRPYSSLSDAADAPKDAGTLFVLESKGTWMHAGYHLTTAIAGPSLLSLPYAFSFLGWAPGLLALTICGLVSSYAYCLLSQVLDDCASKGHRFYRFRELSQFVIGTIFYHHHLVNPFLCCIKASIPSVLHHSFNSFLAASKLQFLPPSQLQFLLYSVSFNSSFPASVLHFLPSFIHHLFSFLFLQMPEVFRV